MEISSISGNISSIGFGCCPLGQYGWGNTKIETLNNAVHAAIEKNIIFFDTSDTYGLGKSEANLGNALSAYDREDYIIASKFGVLHDKGKTAYCNAPKYIKKCIEDSLVRLKTDYLDIYLMHYWDGFTNINLIRDTFIELKEKKLVRYFGLSNVTNINHIDTLYNALGEISISMQLSYFDRKHLDLIKKIKSKYANVHVTSWGSLSQGLLTSKFKNKKNNLDSNDRRNNKVYKNFHGDRYKKLLNILQTIQVMAEKESINVEGFALNWLYSNVNAIIPLIGFKSPDQVQEINEAYLNQRNKNFKKILDRFDTDLFYE
jgi:myo-inositol catabolism protein IolS